MRIVECGINVKINPTSSLEHSWLVHGLSGAILVWLLGRQRKLVWEPKPTGRQMRASRSACLNWFGVDLGLVSGWCGVG